MRLSEVDQFLKRHSNVRIRKSTPNHRCKEQFLTQWHVTKQGEPTIYFVQVSKNIEIPHWVRFGALLELMLSDRIHESDFLKSCVDKYITSYNLRD